MDAMFGSALGVIKLVLDLVVVGIVCILSYYILIKMPLGFLRMYLNKNKGKC